MSSNTVPRTALQLRSLVKKSGELELSLAERRRCPNPAPDEVLVRVEAAPINPSDLGLLFGAADMSTAVASGTPDRPVVTAPVPEGAMKAHGRPARRIDAGRQRGRRRGRRRRRLAGRAGAARQDRRRARRRDVLRSTARVPVEQCLLLPEGATPAEGASCFVNPLTALGMVETMRREGHTRAGAHRGGLEPRPDAEPHLHRTTASRSSTSCASPSRPSCCATHRRDATSCDASAPTFLQDLTEALVATGATIAFDAIGGGRLAGQILGCMEAALNRNAKEYSRYGSTTHKQVYIYGGLDTRPDRVRAQLRHGLGHGRLAAVPVPAEDRRRRPRRR